MTVYALVASAAGTYYGVTATLGEVISVIPWNGAENFTPIDGTEIVAVPDGTEVGAGYIYAAGTFTAPLYAPPSPSAAETAQAAYAALLVDGLTITSSSMPTLNGVYDINPTAQSNITSVATYIINNQKFPNGTTANLSWAQKNGNLTIFPTLASFLAFANAIGKVVYAANIAVLQGGAMPSSTVLIP